MATQVKHRRGTSSEIATRTPAAGEIWVNTDDSSIHVGNGSTVGGTKHATTASVQGKNLIIDGGFLFWHEGTTQTTSGYGSDTMWVNENAGSTKTHTRQTFTQGQTDVPSNPRNFSRTVVSSVAGAGNYVLKRQNIEDVTKTAGKKVTLSFYAKADANKNIATEFAQVFGSGGTPSATVPAIGVTTINLTTSWQKFSVTVDMPSMAGKTLGTGSNDHVEVNFWFDAGSDLDGRTNSLGQQSGTFDIANVKLELGDTATDFGPVNEAATRQKVFRYFFQSPNANGVGALGVGHRIDSNTFSIDQFFSVPMRDVPQLSFSSAGDFVLTELANNNTVTSLGLSGATSPYIGRMLVDIGTTVTTDCGGLRYNSANAYLRWDARL